MTNDTPLGNGDQKPFTPTAAPAPEPTFWTWPLWCPQPGADRNPAMFHNPFDQGFYQTAVPQPQRWPPVQEHQELKPWAMDAYPFNFPQQPEPYPTDPCPSVPSTSMAQSPIPLDYSKMTPAAYSYPNPMFTSFGQPEYQAAITAGWKIASKPAPGKAGIPNVPHRTGPGTNNVRVRTSEKYRAVYTDAQRTELELEFQSQEFITAERKAELAGRLNLTERQVKIWFQNRRAKDRRDKNKK